MNLTESINDIIEQAAGLLSPPDMSGWEPPADAPGELREKLEREEYDRRAQSKIDAYLADRSDRLACLKAIREASGDRAAAYKEQAAPWLRMAERQERIKAYVEQLARNVLEAERTAAGFGDDEPYAVTLANGVKMGLRLSPWSVKVADVEELPGRFVKVEKTALREAIARALEAGKVVPGATRTRGLHVHWGK